MRRLLSLAVLVASVQSLPASAQSARRQMLDSWSDCMWTNHPDMARAFVAPKFSGAVRTGPACSSLLRESNADMALASLRKVRTNRLDACILRDPNAVAALNAPLKPLSASERQKLVAIELEARRKDAVAQGKDSATVGTDLTDSDLTLVRVLRMPMLKQVATAGKRCDAEAWKAVEKANKSSAGYYLMSLSKKAK